MKITNRTNEELRAGRYWAIGISEWFHGPQTREVTVVTLAGDAPCFSPSYSLENTPDELVIVERLEPPANVLAMELRAGQVEEIGVQG